MITKPTEDSRKETEWTKAQLENLYIKNQKTILEISNICKKSTYWVFSQLSLHQIPRRGNHRRCGIPLDQATKDKISKANKGKKRSDATKEKIRNSKIGNKNRNFGKKCNIHGKRCWYKLQNGEVVSMRSQWEVWYAEYLAENNIKFTYEKFTFNLSNGSAYTPDFYLIDTNEYVEVKGFYRQEHMNKFNRFKSEFPNIKITLANKQYLQSLGIDLRKKWLKSKPMFPCDNCQQLYYRSCPQQQFCCVKCRNIAISKGYKSPIKEAKTKRKYNGNQSGEKNNSSKVKESQVFEVRKLHSLGLSNNEIAKQTNLTPGNISNIVNRKSWKHI